jgi:hypothetical protein
MALPVTITGISTAIAPVGPFKVAAGTVYVVKADQTTSVITNSAASFAAVNNVWGQTFTAASSYSLSDIGLYLSSPTATWPGLYVEIRSGSVTGTLLGTSDVVSYQVLSGAAEYKFHFATPISLTSGNVYAFILYNPNAAASSAFAVVGNASSDYAGGAAYGAVSGITNPSTLTVRGTAPFDYAANFYRTGTIASDAYYFFGRDGTTATTLQAFKSTARIEGLLSLLWLDCLLINLVT